MKAAPLFAALLIAGCGSGGGGDPVPVDPRDNTTISYINWGGPLGETVLDLNSEQYKFTLAQQNPSCLVLPERAMVVTNYCQASGQPTYRYLFADHYIDIIKAMHKDGRCLTTVIEVSTGRLIDMDTTENRIRYTISTTTPVRC